MLLNSVRIMSQDKSKSFGTLDFSKEYFYLDPLVFYGDSVKGRLDLYIEIPLGNLTFKRNSAKNIFEASVEYRITIKDSKDDIVFSQTYNELISSQVSDQKKLGDKSANFLKQYYFINGIYKLFFNLTDKNNNSEYSRDYTFAVRNIYQDKISVSDVMLLSDFKTDDSGVKEITPLISNNVGNLKSFYIFFESYNKYDSIFKKTFFYRLIDDKKNIVYNDSADYDLVSGKNNIFKNIEAENLYIGNFKLEIYDKDKVYSGKYFMYRWGDLPVNLKDIDLAINQLVYVADNKQINYIKEGKTPEERMKRFAKFWKDLDPSPHTSKNEAMIEYYNRIKIANDRYSHYIEGWKTDMGMVFIIFGNPSNIERHPFEGNSKPYEIWQYYEINREFIFVDYSGFGDYRLETPIWDERFKVRF